MINIAEISILFFSNSLIFDNCSSFLTVNLLALLSTSSTPLSTPTFTAFRPAFFFFINSESNILK